MITARRNILKGAIFATSTCMLNIKHSYACIGDGPYIKKIRKSDLRNVQYLGHNEYLNHYYPHGYEYSEDIEITNFTNKNTLKNIDIITGEENQGDIYEFGGGSLQLNISLTNIENEFQCSIIRIIHQDNSGKGPCFEIAKFSFGRSTLPHITTRIEAYSGQNPSFFIVAELNSGEMKNKILVSNVFPFKQPCDGSSYLEITNA